MKQHHQPYYGRSHTKKQINAEKPRLSIAECKARKARKALIKLFPHLAPRLHKGVSQDSIYQHAIAASQAPPPTALTKQGKITGSHKAA